MWTDLKCWRWVIVWLVLAKVVYLAATWLAVRLWSDFDREKSHEINARWFNAENQQSPEFISHFSTWDGAHYLYLSQNGYQNGVRSCAFYPLWPLAIREVSILTGGTHLMTGMVLANVFSLVGWILFYQIVAARFGEKIALWALVFLIIFPGSLFYQFIYSEPLFFLLVMVLWLGLDRERYDWAWPAACLLPLCRGVGIFCVLPIAWHLVTRKPLRQLAWLHKLISSKTKSKQLASSDPITEGAILRSYGLLAAPLLGWAAYFGLIWAWTGNPFEGIEAQRFWGAHSISNLINVPKFVIGFFTPTALHDFRGSMLDRWMFILLFCTLPLVWRAGKDLMIWTYVLGILPAMSGTFTSFTRYASTVFPMFIALAVFFTSLKYKWPLALFIILSVTLHAVLLWRFVNFRWAG